MNRFSLYALLILVGVLVVGTSRAVGDLLVASFNTDSILRYDDQTGAFIDAFASGGDLVQPEYMTIGPNGNLYVNSGGGAILQYDGVTGNPFGVFVGPGSIAYGLDFGPDGNLCVAKRGGPAGISFIWKFDGQTGEGLGFCGTMNHEFHAFDLTFRPDGFLYASTGTTLVSVLPTHIMRFDAQTGGFWVDIFIFSADTFNRFIFGPDDNLYLSAGDQVDRYDGVTGQLVDTFASGSGLSSANGMAFGPDGNLYVSSNGTGNILRFDGQTGVFIDVFAGGGGLDGPTALVFTNQTAGCGIPGDVNQDGLVDGGDIGSFVECLLTGGSAGGNCFCGDLDGVGGVDTVDIGVFVSLLLSQ